MKLRRRMRTDLPDDFDSRILPLEISNRLIPNLRRLWFPTDEAELGVLGAGERGIKKKEEGNAI